MDVAQQYEVGRLTFRSECLSSESELLRWHCEQRKIAYREQIVLAPGQAEVLPRVVTPNGGVAGIENALRWLDTRCRKGERIFGEAEPDREANVRLLANLQESLARPAQQLWHFHALGDPGLLNWIVDGHSASWLSPFRSLRSGGLRNRIRARYGLNDFDAAAGEAQIAGVLDKVEIDLARSGTPHLSGQAAGVADVIFAALLSPLICPPNCGARYPELQSWPAPLRELVKRIRARSAGRLALQVYEQVRPPLQPPLPASSYGPSLVEHIFSPSVVRRAGQLLLRLAPRLEIGNRLIVSSWHDVTTVLSRDNDFLIAPVNEARINSVGGPFMLGMDRSPALMAQREHVYSALRDTNKSSMLEALERESSRLLDDALARGGRIDVVNGYSRLVAGRTATAIFGIQGPTEQDYLRVIRSIFHETFLNQSGDQAVRERGLAAGLEIRKWIEAEINRRVDGGDFQDDMLGQLLRSCGGDCEAARLMLGGCLVGAIDTTATAVTNIIAEVIADRRLKEQMTQDVDHPRRFLGWCWEALRRRPHNAGMLRQAGPWAQLAGKPVEEGTQIVLLTVAAMHDPAAFENPNELIPDRPTDRYLHFGYGLHQCAGRSFNAIQIPFLVRELVRRDVSGRAAVRTRGPFPDELIVSLQAPPQ